MFKPILFNTEMVKAIQSGCKTQTRRIIKLPPGLGGRPVGESGNPNNPLGFMYPCGIMRPPCNKGDVLWAREAWYKDAGRYMYRANYNKDEKFYRNGREVEIRWRPSIHMPKEAARIFLRVKEVQVERLQDIKNYECVDEGAVKKPNITKRGDLVLHNRYREEFAQLWDTTIKPEDLGKYGWDANPWVWVIEFERIEKPNCWE